MMAGHDDGGLCRGLVEERESSRTARNHCRYDAITRCCASAQEAAEEVSEDFRKREKVLQARVRCARYVGLITIAEGLCRRDVEVGTCRVRLQ